MEFKNADHFTNYWCKTKGITARDLETHPQADDLVILVHWKDSLWHQANPAERGMWAFMWGIIYNQKSKAKNKHWRKFEAMTAQIHNRQKELNHQREKIKAMRTSTRTRYAKEQVNNGAKSLLA